MAIKKQNQAVIQGEVVAKDSDGFTVLTKQTVFSGTYDNKVTFSPLNTETRPVEIGERVLIKASMVFVGE